MSEQQRENIIFEGVQMHISSVPRLPIKEGLVKKEILPVRDVDEDDIKKVGINIEAQMLFTPSMTKEKIELIQKRLAHIEKNSHHVSISSGCTRRYVGNWEIKDNKLYLLDIDGIYKLTVQAPLFAEWFSGKLIITSGEKLKRITLGFASVYEFEKNVDIENGIVKKIEEHHYTKEDTQKVAQSRLKRD